MKSNLVLYISILLAGISVWENTTDTSLFKASNNVSVSGVSSGGYFAAQMLVAFSAEIKGAGLFASGPYFCTRGTIVTVADWMTTGVSVFTDQLILAAKTYEKLGLIDKTSNLAHSKVFVYSGTSDHKFGLELQLKMKSSLRNLVRM